ncbi:BTAD domain-containing putative transcriptional regulator [Streptomyces sp. NPDC020917]|uniref:AfsR/SARP family transcriptional regulator n=1 Tax=Streptomyces sp. NPDC020917 TaxID=3365102 RepID=UPI0037A292BD
MSLAFGILGPLQVLEDGRPLDLGTRKQQILLAALLCHANARVAFDDLVEALWDDAPPRTARKNVQVYVSSLRRVLGAGSECRISHRTGGYVLHSDAEELDALRFARLAGSGAATDALALWRGAALDGFRDIPLIDAAAQRLDRRFLGVFEDWMEAEIAAGSGATTIERATDIAQQHPFRERLRMLQMTALCQAGRRAEALAVYDELRRALAQELGLSPSPALTRFYDSLLHEPAPAARRETPRRGPATAPNLVPAAPPAFTGRTAATALLTDALAARGSRLAVVTGALGTGKTALAVHVAHRLGEYFPDGRFFVRLRGDDGRPRALEGVLRQLLAAVGRPEPPPGTDLRWAWQLWLGGRRALVVVDDARRESEVRPLLPEVGETAVLVTARHRLIGLDGAFRLCLSPLTVDEAVDFLGRVIGAERVMADPASAAQIVRAAGLLPLGIRLVADRLAFLRHVPLREYGARMTGTRPLLDELCGDDVAVRVRLAESIDDLPAAAYGAVLRLGVLPEPQFTLEQAAAALDRDPDTAVRVLENLMEASVLTVRHMDVDEEAGHTVRYEMPALTYAYARESAAAARVPVSRT